MRTGFEVILTANGEAKFNLFNPFPDTFLVTFAQDSTTAIEAVLLGKLYYQDDRKTNNDAILALTTFKDYGIQGLEKLEGEFALVIYDPKTQNLVAQRDPLGNYPLYWSYHDRTLRISTNLQLLAQKLPQISIDRDFIGSFLMYPYAFVELATQQTAFVQTYRILPGTIVILTPQGNVTQAWAWDWLAHISPIEKITAQEAGLQFKHLFRQAVYERIQHGKVASHLSGGMDSSSVVCMAREILGEETLITLSLVYEMPSLARETAYIQMVIEQGGAIQPYYIDGDTALDFQWFSAPIPEHDEPYAGLFHLAMEIALIKDASKLGVTTILGGSGSELVAQGNRYYLSDLIRQGRWQQARSEANQWSRAKNLSLWSVLSEWGLKPLIPPRWRTSYGSWPNLQDFAIAPWILPDFARNYQMRDKAFNIMRQTSQYPVAQSFNLLELRNSVGNWASWYLGTPQGIQISQPFLDPRLIIYCLSLPTHLREVPETPKPLLQTAMQGILPEAIRTRRFKGNFNEVYWKGLRQNLPHLETMISRSHIDELEIFNKPQLIQAMRQHSLGIGNIRSGRHISVALALIAWFDSCDRK